LAFRHVRGPLPLVLRAPGGADGARVCGRYLIFGGDSLNCLVANGAVTTVTSPPAEEMQSVVPAASAGSAPGPLAAPQELPLAVTVSLV